ncbi:MAG TPA: pyridine nucleotide-disulfide oxidoreductase, partial [Eubacteriaceae bacterium]|nr:pyridine nucleotide-disulfide oxidoreductase [Eubacteriaceae bacterium]
PLAGPANKQGRIVANNICGMEEHYKGVLGTSIVRLFDQVVASTGINEKKLENSGQKKDRDYFVVKIDAPSHAAYLPDSQKMHIKVLFETGSKRALGAQVVGKKGVDKKIDALATLIYFKGTVDDLKNIDYAYSPPFSSAKDALNIVGYVGE